MTPKAYRLSSKVQGPNVRGAIRDAIATLWIVEGQTGFYYYARGCKANAEPTPEEKEAGGVIAETDTGAYVVFKPDEGANKAAKIAFAIDLNS